MQHGARNLRASRAPPSTTYAPLRCGKELLAARGEQARPERPARLRCVAYGPARRKPRKANRLRARRDRAQWAWPRARRARRAEPGAAVKKGCLRSTSWTTSALGISPAESPRSRKNRLHSPILLLAGEPPDPALLHPAGTSLSAAAMTCKPSLMRMEDDLSRKRKMKTSRFDLVY
jgi:hypothetical protein